MLAIRNEDDFNEFMENIIDASNLEHVKIYKTLKQHQFGRILIK